MVLRKAFVDDVRELSTKVSSYVCIERRVVPCDVSSSFSFVFRSSLL